MSDTVEKPSLSADELRARDMFSAFQPNLKMSEALTALIGLFSNAGEPGTGVNRLATIFKDDAACVRTVADGIAEAQSQLTNRKTIKLVYEDSKGAKHTFAGNPDEAREALRIAVDTLEHSLKEHYPDQHLAAIKQGVPRV